MMYELTQKQWMPQDIRRTYSKWYGGKNYGKIKTFSHKQKQNIMLSDLLYKNAKGSTLDF